MYFVAGPTWIMEVVGWYLTYHTRIGMCQVGKLMIFFDVINALQGFFLFLVFYFDKERTSLLWNQCLEHLKRQEENNTPRGRTRTISTRIHSKQNIENWFSFDFWSFRINAFRFMYKNDLQSLNALIVCFSFFELCSYLCYSVYSVFIHFHKPNLLLALKMESIL